MQQKMSMGADTWLALPHPDEGKWNFTSGTEASQIGEYVTLQRIPAFIGVIEGWTLAPSYRDE
jgi:hypothetical protein